ncbi:hypothetical protein BD414DRAFT_488863 [Trametes punicea]|nr:hypothetical protein BD414DRAFT_488863 [Trametes punicea]
MRGDRPLSTGLFCLMIAYPSSRPWPPLLRYAASTMILLLPEANKSVASWCRCQCLMMRAQVSSAPCRSAPPPLRRAAAVLRRCLAENPEDKGWCCKERTKGFPHEDHSEMMRRAKSPMLSVEPLWLTPESMIACHPKDRQCPRAEQRGAVTSGACVPPHQELPLIRANHCHTRHRVYFAACQVRLGVISSCAITP